MGLIFGNELDFKWVLLYSKSESGFRTEKLTSLIEKNTDMVLNKQADDYMIIGVFGSEDDAEQYKREFISMGFVSGIDE